MQEISFLKYFFALFILQEAHNLYVSSALITADGSDTSSQELENIFKNKNKHSKQYDVIDDAADYLFSDELANLSDFDDKTWDVLIFTQQWPVTTCYHWREEDKNHECNLPQKKEFWTIHGIWPTKQNHLGPNFCNASANFDENQLNEIMPRLEQYWPDLESDKDEPLNPLWKHEWLKHGTCAASLPELDNELKYFRQGLIWRDKYLISRLLDLSNIHPDSTNTVIAINNALVNALGKNPSIHCLFDYKNDVSYLAEIRICFNKTLDIIDCDGIKMGDAVSIKYPYGTVNTNCHVASLVHYPSLVPPVQREEEQKKQRWEFPIVNIYKLLQFILWSTL